MLMIFVMLCNIISSPFKNSYTNIFLDINDFLTGLLQKKIIKYPERGPYSCSLAMEE
jgi:hypothetical protein